MSTTLVNEGTLEQTIQAMGRRVADESRIPVLKHDDGICHLYLAADAAEEMAVALTSTKWIALGDGHLRQ